MRLADGIAKESGSSAIPSRQPRWRRNPREILLRSISRRFKAAPESTCPVESGEMAALVEEHAAMDSGFFGHGNPGTAVAARVSSRAGARAADAIAEDRSPAAAH